MTQVLREALNKVEIEGIVEEIDITTGSFDEWKDGVKTGKQVENISGKVMIRVNEDVHTVSVRSNKLKADGSANGIYKGIETIVNEYKSIKSHGIEEADKVRITTGKLTKNEYVDQKGEYVSYPQIESNFINRLRSDEVFTPKAEFTLELYVTGQAKEFKNEEETGRLILKGLVPQYGGRVVPFELTVDGDDKVDYVESNYETGSTVIVYGDIVNQQIVTTQTIPAAFGKDKEITTTTYVREYQVGGGNDPSEVEEEKQFSTELIKQALVERDKLIADKLEKAKNKANSNNGNSKPSTGNKGFGNRPANTSNNVNVGGVDIDESDLPF